MDIARFLQYFRNLSDSFITILAILQDFNGIFAKYCLNITVLCGKLFEHPKYLIIFDIVKYLFSKLLNFENS